MQIQAKSRAAAQPTAGRPHTLDDAGDAGMARLGVGLFAALAAYLHSTFAAHPTPLPPPARDTAAPDGPVAVAPPPVPDLAAPPTPATPDRPDILPAALQPTPALPPAQATPAVAETRAETGTPPDVAGPGAPPTPEPPQAAALPLTPPPPPAEMPRPAASAGAAPDSGSEDEKAMADLLAALGAGADPDPAGPGPLTDLAMGDQLSPALQESLQNPGAYTPGGNDSPALLRMEHPRAEFAAQYLAGMAPDDTLPPAIDPAPEDTLPDPALFFSL